MPARKKHLTPKEIVRLSSAYINEGIRQDCWEITHIDIDDRLLTAGIRMRSYYTSPSDPGGFHLTPFSALEFLSQLTIIFIHVWGGHKEKSREVWMVESSIACKNAIRDPEHIEVRMKLASVKKVKGHVLFETQSTVCDKSGTFEITLKGLLS